MEILAHDVLGSADRSSLSIKNAASLVTFWTLYSPSAVQVLYDIPVVAVWHISSAPLVFIVLRLPQEPISGVVNRAIQTAAICHSAKKKVPGAGKTAVAGAHILLVIPKAALSWLNSPLRGSTRKNSCCG